jgi:hypothetical protein
MNVLSEHCRRGSGWRHFSGAVGACLGSVSNQAGASLGSPSKHLRIILGSPWGQAGQVPMDHCTGGARGWFLTRFQIPPDGICARALQTVVTDGERGGSEARRGTGSVRPAVDSYDSAWDR